MIAIEKKSKLKNWKYNFLFIYREDKWVDVPDGNKDGPIRNSYNKPTMKEKVSVPPYLYVTSDRCEEGA